MKRDMDLVREILLAVEASEESPLGWTDVEIEGRSREEISYHIALLDESKLLIAQDLSDYDSYHYAVKRLTWDGHEFLDTTRDPTIWGKTKEGAGSVGSASFEFMGEMAKSYVKHLANEKLGLNLC
jgi:hypothetical protein